MLYAAARLENIRRNAAELEALLGEEKALLKSVGSACKKERKKRAERPGQFDDNGDNVVRRSSRLVRKAESPVKEEKGKRRERGWSSDSDTQVRRPQACEIREQVFQQLGCPLEECKSPDEWLEEARSRWGAQVEAVASKDNIDWKLYVLSRSVSHPKFGIESPLQLLQEKYCQDPWRLLVSCALMSRVSSAKVKEKCIDCLFDKWPRPSDILAAEPADVENVIAPLGLFLHRYRSIMELSVAFLKMPEFHIDLGENKIYGFGEFALDSYFIFVRGLGAQITPADKNLRAYCTWAKTQRHDTSIQVTA